MMRTEQEIRRAIFDLSCVLTNEELRLRVFGTETAIGKAMVEVAALGWALGKTGESPGLERAREKLIEFGFNHLGETNKMVAGDNKEDKQ